MEENSKRKEALNLLGFSQSLRKSSSTTLKPSWPSNNPFLFLRSVRVGRLVQFGKIVRCSSCLISVSVAQPQQGN
ncbi:hypothetical protein P8452_71061 [Trifolium repens]|nr:hypothetical protein P8452_71061 [Trifolium repens]